MLAFHDHLTLPVVGGRVRHEHADGATGLDRGSGQHEVQSIAYMDWLEESRGLAEEGHQSTVTRLPHWIFLISTTR